MSEQMSSPRITASYLDNFVGRIVTIVGTVTQLRGDQATIDADGVVTILLNREAHLAHGNAAQVIGKVNPDLSIKALSTRDVGPGVGHGVSPLRTHEPQHQPRIAMVWPGPNQNQTQTPIVEESNSAVPSHSSSHSPSSSVFFEPRPRPSIARPYRIASPPPPPLRASLHSPPSGPDWNHHRQQQSFDLDLDPYDPPLPSHRVSAAASQSTSSLPSTAPPRGFTTMPGSFYSNPDSRSSSPFSDDEDMFRLAHDTSPLWQSTNRHYSQFYAPDISPFQPIPSAQPRSIYPPSSSASPPPFTNTTYSTQAAGSLPSPPSSQRERPASPLSVADSLPTLREGDSRQLASPPMSPTRRPQARGRGSYARDSEDTDSLALNAVVDGIGRIQVDMNLDQAGRWRIARQRDDSSW
ncbi:uncharacterized protein Triagg1_1677 [Trichoderma aggressivum f. europaeum]|uniref:Replication factor A protein 3 n=1 Tax=Trichoderma aggressivum f. europaeum TaxID=173218 RepID=A0AAE1M8L3_9HYPO|nr:hypothetical protein Triagg1_1677 [Trichoderma aggressivum f. europaeum]